MKKLTLIFTVLSLLIFSPTAHATSPLSEMTEDEIKTEIVIQQMVYDDNAKLANDIIAELINGKGTFEEKMELRMKLNDARTTYKSAAKLMHEYRIELFERMLKSEQFPEQNESAE